MRTYRDFAEAIRLTRQIVKTESQIIHSERWQGVEVAAKPEMAMHVVLDHSFRVPVRYSSVTKLAEEIQPNLPWADDHFQERLGGEPLNPGQTWQNWPYAHRANQFRDEHGRFSHTYMERMWPRLAGRTDQGELRGTKFDPCVVESAERIAEQYLLNEHKGIYHRYGDYEDVVKLLVREPSTRQAFLPIWFPEDTGDVHQERKPCTLGYLFDIINGRINVVYYIRSCDLLRHFQDDIYLTVRLLIETRERVLAHWDEARVIGLGTFTMHIRNLHIFRNDWQAMFGGFKP